MTPATLTRPRVDFNRTWNRAWNFWGRPRVGKAVVHTKKAEADEVMGKAEIAFFDTSSKETHVHYPNLVSMVG